MATNDLIILIVGIVVAFLILRFITKVLSKLLAFLIVVGGVVYLLFFWKGTGIVKLGNENFIVNELKTKYCDAPKEGKNVKCDCIIKPIYDDIHSQYSDQQLMELKENKIKSIRIVYQSIKAHKDEIKDCLKEQKAEGEWDSFIKDVTNSGPGGDSSIINEIQRL